MKIGILIFDDVELLDMAGPYEVFTTAARVWGRSQPPGTVPCFEVAVVARQSGPVRARAGLRLKPDFLLEAHPAFDLLIVPGGVVDAELAEPALMDWLRRQRQVVPLMASVCTGALLLAQAGLLDGMDATTHWADLDALRQLRPEVHVRENVRWVDAGAVVSSAGISAGVDMSLYLVERLHSRELALRTARQMDFAWQTTP